MSPFLMKRGIAQEGVAVVAVDVLVVERLYLRLAKRSARKLTRRRSDEDVGRRAATYIHLNEAQYMKLLPM